MPVATGCGHCRTPAPRLSMWGETTGAKIRVCNREAQVPSADWHRFGVEGAMSSVAARPPTSQICAPRRFIRGSRSGRPSRQHGLRATSAFAWARRCGAAAKHRDERELQFSLWSCCVVDRHRVRL
jgi:hypothetical protein